MNQKSMESNRIKSLRFACSLATNKCDLIACAIRERIVFHALFSAITPALANSYVSTFYFCSVELCDAVQLR